MKTQKIYCSRFFVQPVPGQIGPQGRGFMFKSASMAAAKRECKAIALRNNWRFLECFTIEPEEIEAHKRGGFKPVGI